MTPIQESDGLELRIAPGAVPKVKNFNASPVFVHAIVDVQRGMKKPPDVRMRSYRSADVRVGLKKIEVIEKIVSKLLGRFGMLFPRPTENLFQIR